MSALRSLLSHLKEFVISASLVFVLGSDSSVQMEWCRCAEPTLNHSGTLPALTLSSTFHNVLASLICALLSVGDASYLLHGSWTLNFFELLPRSARHKTEAHDHGNFRLWVGSSLLFFQAVCCVTGFSVTFLCSFSFFIRQANLSDWLKAAVEDICDLCFQHDAVGTQCSLYVIFLWTDLLLLFDKHWNVSFV